MTKKVSLLIITVMVFTSSFLVKAQESPQYGVILGLNLANLTGEGVPIDATTKAGLTFGLDFQYKFSRYWSIEPQALYSMRGATSFAESIVLNYIEFPLLLKYSIVVSPRAPVFTNLFIGPSFAINVVSKDNVNFNGENISVDLKDSTKAFEYGIVAGAGLDFDLGSSVFNVGARYTFGISTINNFVEKHVWRNGVFAITIGYSFK